MSASRLELPPAAFFSYAHADDLHEQGRLRDLRDRLAGELELQTNRRFEIFFDRDSILVGEKWRHRIEESLNASTFIIPVLTPTYFEREWCRQELETFFAREERLGRSDLVLPIYYVECRQLEDPAAMSADPLATKIAERQWVDWRELRTRSLDDPLVRERVRDLASQLRRAYEHTVSEQPVAAVPGGGRLPPPPAAADTAGARGRTAPSPTGTPPPPAPPPPTRRGGPGWLKVGVALALAAVVVAVLVLFNRGPGSRTAGLEDLSGQSFTVASRWTGQEQDNFELVLKAFEKQTDARVSFEADYDVTGEDAEKFLRGRIAGGNPPDVAFIPSPTLLKDLADEGHLQPLEKETAELVEANYTPFWQELGSDGSGTPFGVWLKAANKSTFWYNTRVFAAAGVEPPETWEDLLAAAGTIADTGTPPFTIGGADHWVLTDWLENIYLRTAGAEAYDRLANHEIPWTDGTVTRALEVFAEILANEEWIAGNPEGTDFEASVGQAYAEPPQAGMVYEGDFVAGIIPDVSNAVVGEEAEFFPFPSIDGSPPSVVTGGDVAVQLTDNPAASEFMKFLATPEAAEIWARAGGLLSPNRHVDPSVYPDDVSRRAADAIVNTDVARYDLSDLAPPEFGGKPGEGMRGALREFLANPHDVEGTQEALEREARAAYD